MGKLVKTALAALAATVLTVTANAGTVTGEPNSNFACSFDRTSTPSGWFTSWGGETPTSYETTMNGQGFKVVAGVHPWNGLRAKDTFSVALYADISAVDASTKAKALLVMGNNDGHIALVKVGANTVEVWQGKAKVGDLTVTSDALNTGFHLFAFGNSSEGSFLMVDGTRISGSALSTPNAGIQVGALYQGFGNDETVWNKALNMVVDEVRGYDRVLSSEECETLAVCFPSAVARSLTASPEGDVTFGNIAWDDGAEAPRAIDSVALTLTPGARLTFDTLPELAGLNLSCAGSVSLASSVEDATAESLLAGVRTVDFSGVTGTVDMALAASQNLTAQPWRYAGGGGSTNAVLRITHNGGTVAIGQGNYRLGESASSTATTVTMDGAEVGYSDSFGIGTATYELGGTTTVTTPKLILSQDGNGRSAALTLKGNAALTVTGETNADNNTSSIMFGHWNGPSTFTLRDSATFTAENAQVLIGKTYNNHTINVEGGSFAAKGITLSANATGTNVLNLSGGTLRLGEVGLGTYAAANTLAVNVSGTPALEASADFSVAHAVALAEGSVLKVKPNGHTITFNKNFTGTGALRLEGAGTVSLTGDGAAFAGTVEVKAGTLVLGKRFRPVVAGVAEGATLIVTANPEDKITGSHVITLAPGAEAGGTVKVMGSNNVVVGSHIVTPEEAAAGQVTVTFTAEPTVTGDGWWWDYEFNDENDENNFVPNSGSEGVKLRFDTVALANGAYTDVEGANKALWLHAEPWRVVDGGYPETFTAVMRCKAGTTENGVMVSFGSSVAGEQYSITLAAGANPAQGDMRLLLTHRGATNGTAGTVTDLVDNLSVPNATEAYHLYAFTYRKSVIVDGIAKTVIDIYKDGDRLRRYVHPDGMIALGNGFQVGSIHGGMGSLVGRPTQLPSDDTGTMDFLRVFRGALSDKAHRKLAETYPYASPNGTATRTVTGDVTWEAEDAWAQGETLQNAPNATTNVELSASADATVALNLSAGTDYETLKLKEAEGSAGAVSVTLKPTDPAAGHMLRVAGLTTVETNATFPVTGMSLGRVFVAVDRTLTFDCAALPPDTVSKALTGYVLDDIKGRFAATNLPENGPWGFTFGYDISSGEFRITRDPQTVKPLSATLEGTVAWAEVPWTWAGAPEGQASLPLNLDGLTCDLTLSGTGTLALPNTMAGSTLTVAAGAAPQLTGTWAGSLTYADGATLDASAGALTVSGDVSFAGALTVRLPEDFTATVEGTRVLAKAGVTGPAGEVTLKAGESEVTDAFLEAREDGLYVTRPTIALLEEGQTLSDDAAKALATIAVQNGVRTLTIAAESRPADGVALFTNVVSVTRNDEDPTQGIATVAYDFGITSLTVRELTVEGSSALYVVLSAKVQGAEGVAYAADTEVKVYGVARTTNDEGHEVETLTAIEGQGPAEALLGVQPVGDVKWLCFPYANLNTTGSFYFKVKATKATAP